MIKKTLLLLILIFHGFCFASSNELKNSYGTLKPVIDSNGELYYFTSPLASGTMRIFSQNNKITTSFLSDYSYHEINIITGEIKDVSRIIKRKSARDGNSYQEIRQTREYEANNMPTS